MVDLPRVTKPAATGVGDAAWALRGGSLLCWLTFLVGLALVAAGIWPSIAIALVAGLLLFPLGTFLGGHPRRRHHLAGAAWVIVTAGALLIFPYLVQWLTSVGTR